ncbi:hypothetical protein EU537_00665 [Candidatus Thorarchaeota archaeon]|nr:MAG: hypothetical protein EU537_00665 [Candidatus Thorarchaeota archaeon]
MGIASLRLKKPEFTCGRVCLILVFIIIITPFIIAWWPKGPHWDSTVRDRPELLWKTNNTFPESSAFSIAIANVDADLETEVICSENVWNDDLTRIVVRRGSTGESKWFQEIEGADTSEIALGTLDTDDTPEFVIAVEGKGIFAFKGNGSVLWYHRDGLVQTRPWIAPTITDVMGDSDMEVVFPSRDGRILILNGTTGRPLWTMSLKVDIHHSVAVGDIDSQIGREIVVCCENDYTYAIRPGNQTPLWLHHWSHGYHWISISAPVIGDINGDDKNEVIVKTCWEVAALNGADGSVLWSYLRDSEVKTLENAPAIGDLDGDGQLEIVFQEGRDYLCSIQANDGTKLWTYDTWRFGEIRQLSLGDFDHDVRNEILMLSDDSKIAAINGEDGSNQWSRYMHSEGVLGQFIHAIGDVNNNGELDFVVSGYGSLNLYAVEPSSSGSCLYWSPQGGATDYSHTHCLSDTDADLDGLADVLEVSIGTNASMKDSDGDLISDAWEFYHGFDPLDSAVSCHELTLLNFKWIQVAVVVSAASLTGLVIMKKREGT